MNSTTKRRSLSVSGGLRKWEKVIQPITRYDRNSSPLGCPLNFFKELEDLVSSGQNVQLNIPITLSGAKDNCLRTVFSDDQQIGRLVFIKSFVKSNYDQEIQAQMQQRLNKLTQKDRQFALFYRDICDRRANQKLLPYVIVKENWSRNEKHLTKTLSCDQNAKINHFQTQQLAQSFIWGSSHHASIVRFFHYPYKQTSEAFKIDNVDNLLKRRFVKDQFKVRQATQGSFTYMKILFTNKSFNQQTAELCKALQKFRRIKITKIVTDWILDPFNRYYLIDVKEVVFQQKEIPKNIRSLSDTLAYISCSVCQQQYRPEEVSKILTDKLIQNFFSHIEKRQIKLSFKKIDHPLVGKKKVCELCYNLVVAEVQLIQLQQKISQITNSLIPDRPQKSSIRSGITQKQLYQWRLFMYLQSICDLKLPQGNNFYLMVRLHNSISAFKLSQPNLSNEYQVKGIKIHYLFSNKNSIDKFLNQSEIILRITRGNNWNNVIAQGSANNLYEQNQKHSMRKAKKILLFDSQSKYSMVGLHIGVKMQGQLDATNLPLIAYHDAYMVDNYTNCYALPAQWMETIDQSYSAIKAQKICYTYSTHLNQNQRKCLFPVKTKRLKL